MQGTIASILCRKYTGPKLQIRNPSIHFHPNLYILIQYEAWGLGFRVYFIQSTIHVQAISLLPVDVTMGWRLETRCLNKGPAKFPFKRSVHQTCFLELNNRLLRMYMYMYSYKYNVCINYEVCM